eukprot:TRINITY_DN91_c0_g1_i1.p1 TRINITY_DN91_c0_g1~~TRINITY_DN91_c0_g1_i1.p1  ORF type:complete len:269 (-),score=35.54 TRINITY_DN91_c0_g1_i1:138-878(-)
MCLEMPPSYRCHFPPCGGDRLCVWCDANQHRSGPLQLHEREPLCDLCDACRNAEAEVTCPGCGGARYCRKCDHEEHVKHKRLRLVMAPCDFCGTREALIQCRACTAYLCEPCDELKHRNVKRQYHSRDRVQFVEDALGSSIPQAPAAVPRAWRPVEHQSIPIGEAERGHSHTHDHHGHTHDHHDHTAEAAPPPSQRIVYTALEYYSGDAGKRSLGYHTESNMVSHYERASPMRSILGTLPSHQAAQ